MDSTVERTGVVTFQGNPLVLLGPEVSVGSMAPDFRVVDGGFKPLRLSELRGRPVLISVVPSLDTPVCAAQTRRFGQEAVSLAKDVVLLTISMDLPFAQQRFCQAEKIGGVKVLSDVAWREFGLKYGLLVKDLGLLARAVFVVDRGGRMAYREIVPEMTSHPNYDRALAALKAAV
jgi:thiol peroxidase